MSALTGSATVAADVAPASYAVVTPARNEAQNLGRLAEALAAQTLLPACWVIADDSSVDDTARTVDGLRAKWPWVRLLSLDTAIPEARGGPVVRAFNAGLAALDVRTDVVVKLDADISFGNDYFAHLLAAFSADRRLGIASGSCWELERDQWRQRFGTGTGVWGACRAYRSECLAAVAPLEERQGWDEIDAIKARNAGWRTGAILDLPFYHHRVEGERDGSRLRVWAGQGDAAHYMGYRPSYVLLRTAFRTRRDAAALAMLYGYVAAVARRRPRCADPEVARFIRRQQALRRLPERFAEVVGRSVA